MVIIDEFYDPRLKDLPAKLTLTLNFKVKENFFFWLHCILFIAKMKLFRGTIGRSLIVFLENTKKCILIIERPNSDFIVLDPWMSILRNFRTRFH